MANSNNMASSSSYSSASSPSSLLPSHQNSIPSKRDKRRNLLSDRLAHISASFERDKDTHCRSQVAALHQDLNAIAREDISGRGMRMLDDGAEEVSRSVASGRGVGNTPPPPPYIRGHEGSAEGAQPVSFYAGFVAEVNERMEERDVALAMLHHQYHSKIGAIRAQHERSIHHTRQEHINLAVTMKQRLINRLYNAKKKLSIDKEHLDISDSSAILLHPNQFSIGSAATGILGSPSRSDIDRNSDNHGSTGTINSISGMSAGGRRKLRQRKNEIEDLVMMGPGGIFDGFSRNRDRDGEASDAKNAAVQKRKARAARASRRTNGGEEEEHTQEDVYGGVHASGVTDGDGSNNGSASTTAQFNNFIQLSQKQKHAQNGNGHGHAAATRQSQAQEMLHKPVYSIEKLFTEKELQMAGNLAALATVKYFLKPKERAQGAKRGDVVDDDGGEGVAEDSDAGTKTPKEEAGPKVGAANPDTMNVSITTGDGQNNRSQGKGTTKANSSGPLDMSCLSPAALFSSVVASANHSRSSNSSLSAHAIPLITPTTLGTQPPPSLSALNFMTPTSTGYGAPAWQSLGVPASFFSAGSGSVVNIATTRMMTLSAPCPASAKNEEAEEDLEMIKSGKGLGTWVDGADMSGEGEPEERVVKPKVGRSGELAKDREKGRRGGDSRDKEKHKEKAREDSPALPSLQQNKGKMPAFDPKVDNQAKEGEVGSKVPSSASNENPHGVKRRASSGIAGGAEKRVRKERENKEKEKEKEKDRIKQREVVPRARGEGDAENGS